MKTTTGVCLLLTAYAAIAHAQVQIRHPNQFYTNGENANAWTRNAENQLQSSLWFAKNPADSLSYKQMIAIVYDSQPNKIYYVDAATKLFVGRLDLDNEQYSMLPTEARRQRLREIDKSKFPASGDVPSVADMFEPLPEGLTGNQEPMKLPPALLQFPGLQTSSWDTSYMTVNRTRVKARIDFDGNRGTYRLMDTNTVGHLSNVQYGIERDGFRIQGRWTLGNANGHFCFIVPADNLNVFWGDWGFQRNAVEGGWGGVRRP